MYTFISLKQYPPNRIGLRHWNEVLNGMSVVQLQCTYSAQHTVRLIVCTSRRNLLSCHSAVVLLPVRISPAIFISGQRGFGGNADANIPGYISGQRGFGGIADANIPGDIYFGQRGFGGHLSIINKCQDERKRNYHMK